MNKTELTVCELRVICDTVVRLSEIRQRETKHLSIEHFAPEVMRRLLIELKMHKQSGSHE